MANCVGAEWPERTFSFKFCCYNGESKAGLHCQRERDDTATCLRLYKLIENITAGGSYPDICERKSQERAERKRESARATQRLLCI